MENLQEESKAGLGPAPDKTEDIPAEEKTGAEESSPGEETEEKKTQQTPTLSYFIRILCSGYLVYLSYGLFTGEGEKKPFILAAAALFALVGIFFVVISLMGLLKKKD